MSNSNVVSLFGTAPQAPVTAPVVAKPMIETETLVAPSGLTRSNTSDYKRQADEMFTVEMGQLTGPYGNVENKRGIFVNEQCINVVSPKYKMHQPIEIAQKFFDVADSHNLEVNRVLSNPKNGGLLLSAKYEQCKILGENHDINFSFYTSHCGQYRTFMTCDLLRIACFNQVPTLFAGKSRWIMSEKHYSPLDIDAIEEALITVPEVIYAYEQKAAKLKDMQFSMEDFIQFYIESYKVNTEAKQFATKIEKLKNTYYNAAGQKQHGANGYKAFQALTFLNTHNIKETAMIEENRLITNGNDSLKQLDRLLAIA